MTTPENNTFPASSDASAGISNYALQWVDIFHVPTGYAVNFKAMMTKFDDAYTSNWNSEAVFGRMDPIKTFNNTTRKISLGFSVVAGSQMEAKNNLERISALIQFLYPSYDADGLLHASPLCKIQFLNWSVDSQSGKFSTAEKTGLLGTIDGFTFSPDLEMGVFVGSNKEIYPKLLEVSFTFDVIHQHSLGWNEHRLNRGNGTFPYLADTEETIFTQQTDKRLMFAAPVQPEQTKVVPQEEKNKATAKELTGAQMRAEYKAEQAKKRKAMAYQQAKEKDHARVVARRKRGDKRCSFWYGIDGEKKCADDD